MAEYSVLYIVDHSGRMYLGDNRGKSVSAKPLSCSTMKMTHYRILSLSYLFVGAALAIG
jgi:hypothetical protein